MLEGKAHAFAALSPPVSAIVHATRTEFASVLREQQRHMPMFSPDEPHWTKFGTQQSRLVIAHISFISANLLDLRHSCGAYLSPKPIGTIKYGKFCVEA